MMVIVEEDCVDGVESDGRNEGSSILVVNEHVRGGTKRRW
jgi:hypothetical protein